MTPNDLINALKLPQDQIDRIKALKAGLEDLESILNPGNICIGDPLHTALLSKAQSCVALVAKVLNQPQAEVQQTLLSLFDITEVQFTTTSKTVTEILALSALVEVANL